MEVDEEGNKYVVFGSGNSSDLGKAAEDALIRWVEELYVRGWPPEWGDIHAAAKSIARSQCEHFKGSSELCILIVDVNVQGILCLVCMLFLYRECSICGVIRVAREIHHVSPGSADKGYRGRYISV